MRDGRYCRAKHMAAVIGYLRAEEHRDDSDGRSFLELIQRRQLQRSQLLSNRDLLNLLSAACPNPFVMGLHFIRDVFHHLDKPWKDVRPCSGDELEELVTFFFVEGGRNVAKRALSESDAIAFAERFLGTSLLEYVRFKATAHAISPWTLAVLGSNSMPRAVASATAVTEEAYFLLRDGSIGFAELTSQQILRKSPWLIVESVAMRPAVGVAKYTSPSLELGGLVTCQHAHLTDAPGVTVGLDQPMHLLSPAGTREHARWLSFFGYKQLSTRMKPTAFPWYERRLQLNRDSRHDGSAFGTWLTIRMAFRNI